jgi:hypothetical protein
MKLCHLTVTFAPALGVTYAKIPAQRHRILEYLRRRVKTLEYVCVVERHRSGKPHLHVVIWYITVRALQRDARDAVHGSHVRARLLRDVGEATYVAKYVGKQPGAKMTSSRSVARAANAREHGTWELLVVQGEGDSEADFLIYVSTL